MSLVDSIATHAARAVDDRAGGWLDGGIERVRDALAVRREELRLRAEDPGYDALPHAARRAIGVETDLVELGREGLASVEARKGALVRLGKARAFAVLAQLGAGRENEARLLYLETSATLEERLAASEASTVATLAAAREREEAWDEVLTIAREVGALALKALIPVLLAAL